MTDETTPQENPQYWIFTFMGSQRGLSDKFMEIYGTYSSARKVMEDMFGEKWAFQYESKEAAGVTKYDLTELFL